MHNSQWSDKSNIIHTLHTARMMKLISTRQEQLQKLENLMHTTLSVKWLIVTTFHTRAEVDQKISLANGRHHDERHFYAMDSTGVK